MWQLDAPCAGTTFSTGAKTSTRAVMASEVGALYTQSDFSAVKKYGRATIDAQSRRENRM